MELKRSVRRRLIDVASRRQRPGAGSSPSYLRKRTTVVQFPDLTPILTSVPWAVVGGVATRLYMPERATDDLDILVRDEDGDEVRRRLQAAGFRLHGQLAIGGSTWIGPGGSNLDVLEMAAPWLVPALDGAQLNLDAQGLPVLPLAYLALMKFESGRVQDLADVTRMLGQANLAALEEVRRVFAQYLPDELDDLESFIALGQMEANSP